MKSLVGTVYDVTGEVWTRNPKNKRLSMLRICPICEKEYYADVGNVKKDMGHYCGYKCAKIGRGDSPSLELECGQCGKKFKEFQSRIDDGKGKYCSKECYTKSQEMETVEVVCDNCGKKFQAPQWRENRLKTGYIKRLFCCYPCFTEASKTGEVVDCENPNCNKQFYRSNYCKSKGKRFCSMKCSGEVICGESHHLWNPDKIGREGHEFTSVQRRLIFEKYGHRCAVTGMHRDEAELHLHHIEWVKNGGTRLVENGVPLWVEVHKKVHFEDYDITEYILGENNDRV